jgi:outer membrane lipoprotein-sorting protein
MSRSSLAIGLAMLVPALMADGVIASSAAPLSVDQIVQRMDEHDRARAESLTGYTCLRRYSLENRRFHKKAELSVRMIYTAPGHKKFEVLSETGPAVIRQRVLRPMLEAEEEAGRDDVRPRTRMVAANYDFKLLGEEVRDGRRAFVLEATPKTRNKFLIRGKVWIDAKDFGIIRVEATPAQNPSVLIHNTRVVQQSSRVGDVWLPLFNHSNTDSFLFGRTEVSIDSWDYKMGGGTSALNEPAHKTVDTR